MNSLYNGNIDSLKDAIDFSNRKYKEFCIKDTEFALMNTNLILTNLDNLTQTKQNLNALKRMISEIICKKRK